MRRATSRLLPWSAALLLLATGLAADTRTGICQSIDIRNYPVQMEKLRGCRIIEGELSIVLMERVNAESFQNMSFPDLREVTDFIKIYRMRGIRNLGDLFPNLTVVRGIRLFKDYALVIFDNENLETLGLRSLARIERGAIRIQHNDRLCYTNTVDWSKIIAEGTENNVIKSNYDSRLCGLCPDAPGRMEDHRNRIGDQCPADNKGRLLCWDDRHCQKLCATRCGDRGCLASGECCHAACLGGCDGPQPTDCHVCRNFSIGYGSERTCVERCPGHTYELVRRCVTEQECRSIPPPRPTSNPALGNTYRSTPTIEAFKIYNRTCIYHCPTGYMEVGDEKNATCELCHGCVRECTGGKVNSVASAELFRGCTHVKGTLEIMLRSSGGNTMAVLESSLGDILEIDGCLKVVRSFPLVSLMFLKSLKTITGKDCPSTYRGQTLHIFNNPNLELLWDWEVHGNIDIQTGTVFIHFNPKLCFESKLSKLKGMIRDPASTFDDMEVSRDNNGDQASCLQAALNLTVQTIGPVFAILTWNNFCLDDMRRLLGYSIYYLPTEQNVTLYGQRDACSDTWNVVDLTFDETRMNATLPTPRVNDGLPIDCNDKEPHFHPLTKLVPFTRYAAYVKTFTTQQDKKGAQSQIIYFRTLPGRPSPPTDLEVDMKTPHSVFISWKPPAMPNGTISIYHVEIQANTYNRQKILARPAQDYCGNPNSLANAIAARVEDSTKKKEEKIANEKAAQCDCSKIDEEEEDSQMTRFNWLAEEERQESINFENDLQNEVYVKTDRKNKTPNNRTRRSIQESREVIPKSMLVILSGNISPQPGLKYSNSTDLKGYVKSLYYDLDGSTKNLHIEKMRHFTWYTVNIWACRAKHPNETEKDYNETWCSEREHYIFRTLEEIGVDMVHNVQAEIVPSNKTLPEVNVTWEPPGNPNGFVVAYNVHHSLVDDTAQQTQDVGLQACVMADDFEANGRSYLIRNLAAGNYSIRVTPLTVSGAGNVSSQVYIYIPERRAESGYLWVWGVVAGCACTALLAGAGVWHARRGLRAANDNNKLFASVNPEYVATVYVPDEWEVPRANIEFIRELGQGSFGMVYEGLAKNMQKGKPETRCAVKTVNEHATDRERIEFLNEASVMKAFDTFHVVRLLGVVSRGQPTLVVMELMERGDLKTYLRSHRPDQDGSLSKNEPPRAPPTLQNILQMAIEIADGMAYLAAKKFVHRDLAARNCMVAGDLTVKVGDFGMTRDIYETDYYRKGTKGLLPVRWMSPESLKDGVFSSSSDVWSYGVVLWEMATLAMQPYQGLSNEQVVRYVIEGGVMERPEHCPDRLYDLMRACWAHRAAQRPSFLRLVADLAPTCMPYFRQRSFFHSPLGQELYSLQAANLEEEAEMPEVNVGAAATGSGSNLFGVSGRLASWVRELSSLRSRSPDDAAAEPLQPAPAPKGPNGVATSHC